MRGATAYVGYSSGGSAGAFLSGFDKRFKALVLMADKSTKSCRSSGRKWARKKTLLPLNMLGWTEGKYASQASPATVFLQYASSFFSEAIAKLYSDRVSEPKKLKIYKAPHALNADATQDRIAFLADELSFKLPDVKAIVLIPALNQPPWPKPN